MGPSGLLDNVLHALLNFSGRFDTSGSMIPLSVSKISALDGFCDGRGRAAGRGIGYSSSWILTAHILYQQLSLFQCICKYFVQRKDRSYWNAGAERIDARGSRANGRSAPEEPPSTWLLVCHKLLVRLGEGFQSATSLTSMSV